MRIYSKIYSKHIRIGDRINESPKSIWQNPIHFIACGFGMGAMPLMPGTFGTLVAFPIYLLCYRLPLSLYIGIIIFCVSVGCWICAKTHSDFGATDHSAVVWDEISAFLIVMIEVPFTWRSLLIGFLLFRLLDIVKPFPISWVDRSVYPPVGVMLDDIVAAFFAWIILKLIVLYF